MRRIVAVALLVISVALMIASCGGSEPASLSLKSIRFNGAELEGFSPDKYEYEIVYDKKDGVPTKESISYDRNDRSSTVELTSEEGAIVITLTSADGKTTKEYRINMKEKPIEITSTSAEIVNKNGAKGVLTLISDDGDQRTSDFFYTEIVPTYNSFKITIALPTKKVASLSKTADGKAWLMNEDGDYVLTVLPNEYRSQIAGSLFASNKNYATMVDFWNKITDTGAIELASHSHTHAAWGVTDEYNSPYPAGNVIKELHASAQILRDLLGQESHFILRPGGHEDLTSAYFYNLVETDDTFIGMRGSNGAPPLPGVTSANGAKLNTIEKFQKADGRLRIATLLVRGYEAAFNEAGTGFATASGASSADCIAAGISAWTQYVDYAMQYGSWASIGFHAVVPDSTATASGYAVFDSQVKALMDYVEPLAESGELWLASFSDAAKYYFEWSSATVSATTYGDERVEVTLTDREEDERFDEPLTVKVTVPDGWRKAELESYGVTTELTVHTAEDGTRFVYANILPGEGVSTVRGK